MKKRHNICKECGVTKQEALEVWCERWDSYEGEWYEGNHHVWTY